MNQHRSRLILLGAMLTLTSPGCSSDSGNDIVGPPTQPPPEPPAPEITAISPDSGKFGTEVTITGSSFAAAPQENTVTFNGMEAAVTSAGETELTAEVPQGAESGPVVVTVAERTANGPEFTYLPDNARFVNNETGSDAGNDCNDFQNSCATISHAIDEADSGDLIDIAPGAYTETLTLRKRLSLQGAGQDPLTGTIIQAHADSGMANSRVIFIAEGNVVSIGDLTIRHGHVSGGGQSGRGGGIRVVDSTLNLTNVTLEKNEATYGGAIHNGSASGTYTNVTFRNNIAVMGSADNQGTGGGLYNSQSSPTLEGVAFLHNKADRHGGGIRNANNSSPLLVDVTFVANSATFGGGMYNSGESMPTLTNVEFHENEADNKGGGMYNTNSSPLLTDVIFSANVAIMQTVDETGGGGGIYNRFSSPILRTVTFSENRAVTGVRAFAHGGGMLNIDSAPTLTDVRFIENAADKLGGGMYNTNSSPSLNNVMFEANSCVAFGGGMANLGGAPTLTNVTFGGNSSGNDGGGMFNTIGSTPTLMNVTISGNSAGRDGGGINNYANSAPTLTNTIVWGNSAGGEGTDIHNGLHNSQGSITLLYSLYNNGPGAIVEGDGVEAKNSLTVDPLFIDVENGDLRLQAGSPAIDAGDPNIDLSIFTTDESGNRVDVDGSTRVVNGRIDIGAHENQGSGQ